MLDVIPIIGEFQRLAVGDKIPWDGRGTGVTVEVLKPFRALVLSLHTRGIVWIWQFGLYPIDERRTRLVNSGMEQIPNSLPWWLFERISELAAFPMTRRFMLGVKERAEALGASAPPPSTVPPRTNPKAGVGAAG